MAAPVAPLVGKPPELRTRLRQSHRGSVCLYAKECMLMQTSKHAVRQ